MQNNIKVILSQPETAYVTRSCLFIKDIVLIPEYESTAFICSVYLNLQNYFLERCLFGKIFKESY